ncbi:MAG: hypothetical protein NUV77_14320 [Thermoguttaceae bacterium]|nr:hypothetical protein [Thermoguttaceae bacterium]
MTTFLLVTTVFVVAETPAENEAELALLVRRAALSSRANLKSGQGSGVYREYRGDGSLEAEIPFEIAFRGEDKYHLRLKVGRAPLAQSAFQQRIAVSDGSAAFSRDFNTAPGDNLAIEAHGANSFQTPSGGMRDNLPVGTGGLIRAEHLEKHPLHMERLPNGNLRGRYKPSPEVVFEASPHTAYNVIRAETWSTENSGQVCEVDWAKDHGVWYVQRKKVQYVRAGKPILRYEWQYDRFEANPTLPDELFTLAALSLRKEDRILDLRSGHSGWHRVDPVIAEEGRLATMAEQLEKMPQTLAASPPVVPSGVRILIVAINAAAVIAVLVLWRLHRARVRRETV